MHSYTYIKENYPISNINPLSLSVRQFRYADPDIGGGKTYALKQHVAHPFSGKAIIAVQSIALAKETEADLLARGVSVLRIDTTAESYNPDEPTTTCTAVLNTAMERGYYDVLICNQDVAIRADERFAKEFHLFMDEITPVYQRIWLEGIVTSRNNVVSYLTSMPVPGTEKVRRIITTDEGETFLKTQVNEKLQKAEKALIETIRKTQLTAFYEVYAEAPIWSEFRSGQKSSLVLHAILKPTAFDRFRSVTILGANFARSLMNKIWSRFHGVRFDINDDIMNGTRYARLKDHMSSQVRLFYLTDRNCSKFTYNQIDYQPTFNAAHDALKRLITDIGYKECAQHLVFINNRPKEIATDFYWKDAENGVLLSPLAKGLDAYSDIDIAVHLAAINENADTYRVLYALFNFSKQEIDEATALERAYQAVGRCSLRDKDRSARTKLPVVLVFFDYRTARFVADIVGCKPPELLDSGLESLAPKLAKTSVDYDRTKYHKQQSEAMTSLPAYDGFIQRRWMDRFSPNFCEVRYPTWDRWVEDMRDFSANQIPPRKESAAMYREGWFKSCEDHRTKGNIASTKVITLDFDDVTGDPVELAEYLYENDITFLITNSYSSTREAPRFRLDIPLSHSVNAYGYSHIVAHLTAEIGTTLYRQILGEDGELKRDPLFVPDKSKTTMLARFHTPSLSVFDARLFIDGGVMSDGELVFLDVDSYMERAPIQRRANAANDDRRYARKTSLKTDDSAEDVFRHWEVSAGQELGSWNFYQAIVELLFKVGLSREQTIEVAHANRHRFGNGEDRDARYVVDAVLEKSRSRSV